MIHPARMNHFHDWLHNHQTATKPLAFGLEPNDSSSPLILTRLRLRCRLACHLLRSATMAGVGEPLPTGFTSLSAV
jgi:hypothetical protein